MSSICYPDGEPARGAALFAGTELTLDFRASGNAARYCTTGWSVPEAAETWCIGHSSTLTLPAPAMPVRHLMVLHIRPHLQGDRLRAQRLVVFVNDVWVASFVVTEGTVRACVVPADILRGAALDIRFETPDAARPADFGASTDGRALALAFGRFRLFSDRLDPRAVASGAPAVGPDDIALSDLMLNFESLGQNCEFGLVQRRGGAEPLGLLRFASTPLPNLLAALAGNFAGMGTAGTIRAELSANGQEFMIRDTCYGLLYHAWVPVGQMSVEDVTLRELRRIPLLVRKLREELALGQKLFLFRGMGVLSEEIVFPLSAELRRYGPNSLLFITLADARHPASSVEVRAPGFLTGYLDRFAPGEDAYDFLFEQWIEVCRNALRKRGGALIQRNT